MTRNNRHIVYLFSALLDAAIIAGCFFVLSSLHVGTITGMASSLHTRWYNFGAYAVVFYACLLSAAYAAGHVYGNVFYERVSRMAGIILGINTVGILAFGTFLYATKLGDFSRWTLGAFYVASTLAVIVKHWIEIKVLYRRRRRPEKRVPVLVVGDGPLAFEYADLMETDPTRFEHVIGYVSPGGQALREVPAAVRSHTVRIGNVEHPVDPALLGPCLGSVSQLDQVLSEHDVSQLVIALEAEQYPAARTVMAVADKHGVFVRIIPFFTDLIPRNPAMESVQDLTLIDVRTTALDNLLAAALKRAFDILASAFILVLISPILLITAIGVRLSSPGPILYKQERIGKDRRPFNMLKFRSMRMADGPISTFTEDKDARKTKFGSFIRKYSIDELPQFINVLAGNMSIVGPRPVVREETYTYMENIPLYMLRYQVRPGITGWAQVNGYRGDPSLPAIEERTKYDLYYIEHWSPWLDVRIFFRTIFGGFMNSEKVKK